MEIYQGYILVSSPGVTCWKDNNNYCDGWFDINSSNVPVYKTNDINQFTIHRNVFQSQLQEMKLHNFIDETCAVLDVVNTGILINCKSNEMELDILMEINANIRVAYASSSVAFFDL